MNAVHSQCVLLTVGGLQWKRTPTVVALRRSLRITGSSLQAGRRTITSTACLKRSTHKWFGKRHFGSPVVSELLTSETTARARSVGFPSSYVCVTKQEAHSADVPEPSDNNLDQTEQPTSVAQVDENHDTGQLSKEPDNSTAPMSSPSQDRASMGAIMAFTVVAFAASTLAIITISLGAFPFAKSSAETMIEMVAGAIKAALAHGHFSNVQTLQTGLEIAVMAMLLLAVKTRLVPRMIGTYFLKTARIVQRKVRVRHTSGTEWRWNWIKEAARPVGNILQAGLMLMLLMSVSHAWLGADIASGKSFEITLPHLLQWLDLDGDGVLSFHEAQTAMLTLAKCLFNIEIGLNISRFIISAKSPKPAPALVGGVNQTWREPTNTIDRYFATLDKGHGKRLPWEDRARVQVVDKSLTIAAYVIGVLPVLNMVGMSIPSILAFGGVGGLAIGFAAQTTASNAISGVLLMITRPFMEGDTIILASGQSGNVVSVGWHSTKLMTNGDGMPRTVPNNQLSNSIICNESRRNYHAIQEKVEISVGSNTELRALVDHITLYLRKDPGLLHMAGYANNNTRCFVEKFVEGGVQLHITAFVEKTASDDLFNQRRSTVLLDVVDMIMEHGCTIHEPIVLHPQDIQTALAYNAKNN